MEDDCPWPTGARVRWTHDLNGAMHSPSGTIFGQAGGHAIGVILVRWDDGLVSPTHWAALTRVADVAPR